MINNLMYGVWFDWIRLIGLLSPFGLPLDFLQVFLEYFLRNNKFYIIQLSKYKHKPSFDIFIGYINYFLNPEKVKVYYNSQ